MKKTANIAILIFSLLFVSCHSGSKKKMIDGEYVEMSVKRSEVTFPNTKVLNLKSYYLSATYQNDSLNLLYGYNYKTHSLDRIALDVLQISQIPFSEEGVEAINRPISGIFVHTPDSIWIYDASERALLINGRGNVLSTCDLRKGLTASEVILVNSNYAMCTANIYYDQKHHSLLYGVKNLSSEPVSFKVREVFLNNLDSLIDYPLQPSVVIQDIGDGNYANMGEVNISFGKDKIIYNYPVESHVYLLNRDSRHVEVVKADSRFTLNKAEKCLSKKDYAQWERHGIENPHFYNVMYLPNVDLFARLHVGEKEFDNTKELSELINSRDLYLMFFDNGFSKLGEIKLLSCRYNFFTGWCALADGVLLFVDNAMDSNNIMENLQVDVVRLDDSN